MENKSLADIFDSYINWLVISIFLMALNLAFEAIAYLTPEATSNTLNALAQWLAYGSLIALAVAAIIWFRLPRDRRRKQNRVALLDGFVVEIAKRSAAIAFFVTLCLVAVLDVVTNTSLLPADFFVKLLALSLTAVFSVSFFYFNSLSNRPIA